MMFELRACLAALTDALDRRALHDTIHLDVDALQVHVDSSLDDAEARAVTRGRVVPPPDGLYEWQARRDFVRSLEAGSLKKRLGDTLGGTRTKRRFEVVLATSRVEGARDAFRLFRRRRLRAYAGRVIRVFLHPSRIDSSTSCPNGVER